MKDWLLTYTPLVYLTQSLWRDETFSVAMANYSFVDIIRLTAADFNTPLYYLMLHAWIKVFGPAEISIRLLSFLPHVLLTRLIYRFAASFTGKADARIIAMAIALNPMLLTYAFEARAYSWLVFFASWSMYALYRQKWLLYGLASLLAFYTHAYFLFLIPAQVVYQIVATGRKKHSFFSQWRFFLTLLAVVVAMSPGLSMLANQWQRSQESWIYPVDLKLVLSVLGNLFTSYDGTPGGLWWFTAVISVFLLFCFAIAYQRKPAPSLLCLFWVGVPTVLVVTLSFFKPLFVNRYLIFVTVGITIWASLGILSLTKSSVRQSILIVFFVFLMSTNFFFPTYRKKFDSRELFTTINDENQDGKPVVVDALFYFDALYYYHDRQKIFVYHDPGRHIPAYVGAALIPKTITRDTLPEGRLFYQVNAQGEVYLNLLQ